ncbi:MAG: ArsR family transcriptional regulator [Desulfobacterales bacterium]|nr:ArsR family transcriptional regulator [Desulfobacterales bacterium]
MNIQRSQTIRQEIISLLEKTPMTAREISQAVRIMEKDVPHHLAAIQKSLKRRKKRLKITPCCCRNCGFEFRQRNTFKKPGKCPGCRNPRIISAVFQVIP